MIKVSKSKLLWDVFALILFISGYSIVLKELGPLTTVGFLCCIGQIILR